VAGGRTTSIAISDTCVAQCRVHHPGGRCLATQNALDSQPNWD
jgi:hypothetical protein